MDGDFTEIEEEVRRNAIEILNKYPIEPLFSQLCEAGYNADDVGEAFLLYDAQQAGETE